MRLNVVDVSARFGPRALFEKVSFEAHSGEVVAVVGPSGSGKSTLLGIASGLLAPDAGTVTVTYGDCAVSRAIAAWCAWVPQGAASLGARTALDNAMLGGLGRGFSRRESQRHADCALRQVGLVARRTTRAALLSGGELQRLAIARALCFDRPFLFADEPTGSLDATNTRGVFELFRAAADEGTAVVLATHDLSVVGQCDQVVQL